MIKQVLKKLAVLYYNLLNDLLKPDKKNIVFISGVGRSITGNPAAICRSILNDPAMSDYTCTWIINSKELKLPAEFAACKSAVQNTPAYFKCMAKAGIWISDGRLPDYLVKRPDVLYIQTWHGTPLKKLALDMDKLYMSENKSLSRYKEEFKKNTASWDCLISQNPYSTEIFRRCFAFSKTMLEIGYPRNDVLFSKNNPEDTGKLKQKFGLPQDKKVLLYAPTWRDDKFHSNGAYKFISDLDFDEMYEKLSADYVLLIKYHYLVKENIDWSRYDGFVRAFSADTDINKLYLVSDMLITDYSSTMFDYSLLSRPILFYVPDLENYGSELRGFYFDLFANAPGPVSDTTQKLCTDILEYSPLEYSKNYKAFKSRFNTYDDGHASEKVKDYILHHQSMVDLQSNGGAT